MSNPFLVITASGLAFIVQVLFAAAAVTSRLIRCDNDQTDSSNGSGLGAPMNRLPYKNPNNTFIINDDIFEVYANNFVIERIRTAGTLFLYTIEKVFIL